MRRALRIPLDGVLHRDCDWDRLPGKSISGWKEGEVDAEEDIESIVAAAAVVVGEMWGWEGRGGGGGEGVGGEGVFVLWVGVQEGGKSRMFRVGVARDICRPALNAGLNVTPSVSLSVLQRVGLGIILHCILEACRAFLR